MVCAVFDTPSAGWVCSCD